jgi:hypothetical protein
MKRLPTSVYVVAGLFLLEGLWAVARSIARWADRKPDVPLGIICIFIGLGLLWRRSGWRRFAVGWSWLWVVVTGACLTWFVFSGRHAQYSGPVAGWLPKPDIVLAGYLGCFCVLSLWATCVLTRPHVKECFGTGASANAGGASNGGPAEPPGNSGASEGPPAVT